ncbi:MAG TPA: hypothetical protein VJY39_14935 [Acidisphaera sp.]|nr:hypothetical protein [Acidisphaera sp.]
MARVGAQQRLLDLAPRREVVRAAGGGAHREPGQEMELRREGLRAGAGAGFACCSEDMAAVVAVLPAFGDEAHGGAAGEAVQPAFGLPIPVPGGEIEGARAVAGRAARAAAPGPGVRGVAPRGDVAGGLGRAEQAPGLGAERVLHDVEPVQPVAPGGGGFGRGVGDRARGAGVGPGPGEAPVEVRQTGGKPA